MFKQLYLEKILSLFFAFPFYGKRTTSKERKWNKKSKAKSSQNSKLQVINFDQLQQIHHNFSVLVFRHGLHACLEQFKNFVKLKKVLCVNITILLFVFINLKFVIHGIHVHLEQFNVFQIFIKRIKKYEDKNNSKFKIPTLIYIFQSFH